MNTKKIKKFLKAVNPKPKTVARKIKNRKRAILRRLETVLFSETYNSDHKFSGLLEQICGRHFGPQEDKSTPLVFSK